jgi:hypothetical protein
MSPADRDAYAAAQAELLHALIRGDTFPDGFDAEKAAAASRSLWRKRAHAVAAAWPALAAGLGERFDAAFEQHARATPAPSSGGALADGLAFARTLAPGELTEAARVELLFARAIAGRRGGTPRPRRGIFAGALWLHDPRRILVVLRAPGIGRRRLVVTLGR